MGTRLCVVGQLGAPFRGPLYYYARELLISCRIPALDHFQFESFDACLKLHTYGAAGRARGEVKERNMGGKNVGHVYV